MIIDLMGVLILAWATLIGYGIGGYRILLWLSVFVGTISAVEWATPWLQLFRQDYSYQQVILRYLRNLLAPDRPASAGKFGILAVFSQKNHTLISLYRQSYAIMYAISVAFGLFMAIRIFSNVWPDQLARKGQQSIGGWLGLFVGLYMVLEMVHSFIILSYWSHASGLTSLLRSSLLIHLWTLIYRNGMLS
ncbi:hypothetical protein [Ferroacidibacillus organovorans]|uniref:Uncharacterized protein n=1 Tax=Ferroacidibacillus organovorans TaxID=1765683 RepID=A0A101XS66_9BACL|nr:hypothetical protein [Ferroacidibacillus organovorans]KUO96542.1 hypothetical protein ATW55_00180 [Ferroacidibacillus organovorans]